MIRPSILRLAAAMVTAPWSATAIVGTGPRHHAGFTLLHGTIAILALVENDNFGSRCRSPPRTQADIRRVRSGHPKHKRGCDSPAVGGSNGRIICCIVRQGVFAGGDIKA
jgi:hypothetical protein